MPLFEFYASGTPSLYGEGDANQASKLTSFMNLNRALNRWEVREIKKAKGQVLNIAYEIERFFKG